MAVEPVSTTVSSLSDEESFFADVREGLDQGLVPSRLLNDRAVHEMEMERIFAKTWSFVGHVTEIPDRGDYTLRYIGNDPFIFARDENGQIQVLFNSCRHRGTNVCRTEKGNSSHFRCPYHGWTYQNTGKLVGVPRKDECFADLDPDEWGLKSAPRVDEYAGFVFASLNPDIESLEEYLGDLTWHLDILLDLTEGGMEAVGDPVRRRIDVNWKTVLEANSGDAYHTASTHQSAFEAGIANEGSTQVTGRINYSESVYADGHSLMYRMYTDEFADSPDADDVVYWAYPAEVKNRLNETLTEGQKEVARKSNITASGIFPSMGIAHTATSADPNEPDIGVLQIRKIRPISANETEEWDWLFVPAETSSEYKQKASNATSVRAGTSGVISQDDIAVWRGITKSAASDFARTDNYMLNYQMGIEAQPDLETDDEWPGPGEAYQGYHDGHGRRIYENWYRYMTEASASPLS